MNRVIKDLSNNKHIFFEKDKKDTRLKHIYLSESGQKLFNEIFSIQKKESIKRCLIQVQKKYCTLTMC